MFEKISAEEFARRHGWRTSAVVHRIRAGIYEGVEENGTWYVLRDAPSDVERTEAGLDYVSPPLQTLPWPTTPGRLWWVTAALWSGMAAMILPFVLGDVDQLFSVFAVGLILAAAPQLYEGLASGVMRGLGGLDEAFTEHPVRYVVVGISYLVYTLIGLFILYIELFGGPQ